MTDDFPPILPEAFAEIAEALAWQEARNPRSAAALAQRIEIVVHRKESAAYREERRATTGRPDIAAPPGRRATGTPRIAAGGRAGRAGVT